MYYIHNYVKDTYKSIETWWQLLAYFHTDEKGWWAKDTFSNIAHSENDKRLSYVPVHEVSYNTKAVYEKRTEKIYDEDFNIINISEIKNALKTYIYKEEVYPSKSKWMRRRKFFQFEFRKDPVPYVGTGRGGGSSYRKPKRNKNYFAKLQEFTEFDSRVRKGIFDVSLYWDDFSYRDGTRSWKSKKKIKQWM